jgi:hypothetical protein
MAMGIMISTSIAASIFPAITSNGAAVIPGIQTENRVAR